MAAGRSWGTPCWLTKRPEGIVEFPIANCRLPIELMPEDKAESTNLSKSAIGNRQLAIQQSSPVFALPNIYLPFRLS